MRDRGLDIHEERVADQSREDSHAVPFEWFADGKLAARPSDVTTFPFCTTFLSGTSSKVTSIVYSAAAVRDVCRRPGSAAAAETDE